METQNPLLKDEDGEEVDVHMYRSMIGSLMYLTSSRPDIMFTVCACTRYQVNPKVSHLHVVKKIFRYLKGQPKLGLWYPKDSPFDLVAYTDSDYARASLDRKSTTGGSGPRCQDTIGDTIVQTRFENVSKHSNDSLLARGNTLRSDEDSLKLNELMELCTNLQNRVLDLEKTKTTQANEIASLKRRVKKLKQKKRLRTHRLKRLYKLVFKMDADKEMFNVNALDGEEVFVAGQNENVVEEVVDAAQVSTAATTVTITTEEITLVSST
ncbi:hypothetical protein Tco_0593558 [Tanacetum coccineum]